MRWSYPERGRCFFTQQPVLVKWQSLSGTRCNPERKLLPSLAIKLYRIEVTLAFTNDKKNTDQKSNFRKAGPLSDTRNVIMKEHNFFKLLFLSFESMSDFVCACYAFLFKSVFLTLCVVFIETLSIVCGIMDLNKIFNLVFVYFVVIE